MHRGKGKGVIMPRYDGRDNLKVPTSEKARENGKKGGLASGKAKRERMFRMSGISR